MCKPVRLQKQQMKFIAGTAFAVVHKFIICQTYFNQGRNAPQGHAVTHDPVMFSETNISN